MQRLLIEEGLASVSISNPEYTYAAQLQAAQSQPVIANGSVNSVTEYSRRRGEVGLAVLCFMTSGFLVLWILGVRHARRRHPQRS